MRLKRILSVLLAAALTAALALPAAAAGSSFRDVSDLDTAVNADVLRLMGVVSGVGDNTFNPGGSLTRAEFCALSVLFMGKGDEVPLHATRTIFTDVTARHWALGYINLAASLPAGDGEDSRLITGIGDGRFLPDERVTLAEAATILLHILKYPSEKTGTVWPQSYMTLANSIGLTDGIAAASGSGITRAQAARLFVNALRCKTGDGTSYYETLGTVRENAIVLAVNTRTDDGSAGGAVRAAAGSDVESYLPAHGSGNTTALQGKRGALVLNDRQEIVAFVPDDSDTVTVTLSGDAQPSYLTAVGGQRYTISSGATVYAAGGDAGSAYSGAYSSLHSGMSVTLFSERGKITAVYAEGASSSSAGGAVVVQGNPSAAMFQQLTGGATGWRIQKNRQEITLSQIKEYDVVTYDSLSNTLIVSDLRLSCIYEDAAPNAKAPETVNILGAKFDVLDSAWDSIAGFKLGDQVVLLLTADGKVAGMAKPSASVRSTAVGMLTGGGVRVFRPDGDTIELSGTLSGSSNLEDRLVTVSSSSRDRISVSRLTGQNAPGDFDTADMKLGSYTVTSGVRVYEQVGGGAMVPVSLSGLDRATVSAGDIALYHLNTSGMVDYLVLEDVTGDAYTYGKLIEKFVTGGLTDMEYTNRTVQVENHGKGTEQLITGYSFKNGGFGGTVAGSGTLDGTPKAAAVIELTEYKSVSPSDFFLSQGVWYVTISGRIYRVADEVECYKAASKDWFDQGTGAERLEACRAFSSDLNVYIDPVGQKVRVVQAN